MHKPSYTGFIGMLKQCSRTDDIDLFQRFPVAAALVVVAKERRALTSFTAASIALLPSLDLLPRSSSWEDRRDPSHCLTSAPALPLSSYPLSASPLFEVRGNTRTRLAGDFRQPMCRCRPCRLDNAVFLMTISVNHHCRGGRGAIFVQIRCDIFTALWAFIRAAIGIRDHR